MFAYHYLYKHTRFEMMVDHFGSFDNIMETHRTYTKPWPAFGCRAELETGTAEEYHDGIGRVFHYVESLVDASQVRCAVSTALYIDAISSHACSLEGI